MQQTITHHPVVRIRQKLEEITCTLANELKHIPSSGLYGGKAGISLYFAYLGRYRKCGDFDTILHQLIQESFDDINDKVSSAAFSFGISGILWNIHHLRSVQLVDTDDYFEEVIPFLGEQMLVYARQANVDFLHGALGIAFYLLHFKNKETDAYLSAFLKLLGEKAIHDKNGIKWQFSMNRENKATYNLSLSHGLSSVIVFLSKYLQEGGPASACSGLLENALHYLVSQKNHPTEDRTSIFPNSGELLDEVGKDSRLAWCYGDLGIAAAFWQGGKALNKSAWKQEALQLLQHAAKRRDLKANHVVDAGLCHGTAGIAHVFNRFYREMQQPFLKEAADHWIEETIKLSVWNNGLCGYKSWQGEQGWINQHGILEGIAGIGLALIGHLDDQDPSWDSAFLLS